MMNWEPIILSLTLASITTGILLLIGLGLGFLFQFFRFPGKMILKAIFNLPLVLPPTVLGFYLLLAFQPTSILGSFFSEFLGISLLFSFEGILIGSVIFSLPFMVNPLLSALDQIPVLYRQVAFTLGKSNWSIYRHVYLPTIRKSLWTGIAMAFAHTLGEFGVVLMIGGSIPGETKVASIAIFDLVEGLKYDQAHTYAGVLLIMATVILIGIQLIQGTNQNAESRISN